MDASIVDKTQLLLDEIRKIPVDGWGASARLHQKTISILVPTRRRPALFCRMLNNMFSLADSPDDLEVIAYIDDDDTETLALDTSLWNVVKIVGPRETMGKLNAACYARSSGNIIMLGNDDMVVRTRGWDKRVREEIERFPDKVYLLYPNDLYKGSKICTFPILSRVTCDTIGDPFPADYRGAFIDVHVMDIFKRLHGFGHQRIAYLDDVIFEHMHYRAGKSACDATYRERDRFGDDRAFLALHDARGSAVQRLKAIIDGTESTSQERLAAPRPVGGWFLQLTWNILHASSSPFLWRLRLFSWMWLRFACLNVKKIINRKPRKI